nr:15820_t:CDS:2 [Entrophospora candida]
MQRLVRIQEKKFFAVEQICDVTHKSMLLANCHFVGYMEELGGLPTSVLKQLKITYSVCLVLCPVDFNVTKVAGIWNALSSSAENSTADREKYIKRLAMMIELVDLLTSQNQLKKIAMTIADNINLGLTPVTDKKTSFTSN